jgi:hypothetical protein
MVAGGLGRLCTAVPVTDGSDVSNVSPHRSYGEYRFQWQQWRNKNPPSDSKVVSVLEPATEKNYFFSATTLVNLPFSKASLPKTAST